MLMRDAKRASAAERRRTLQPAAEASTVRDDWSKYSSKNSSKGTLSPSSVEQRVEQLERPRHVEEEEGRTMAPHPCWDSTTAWVIRTR